MWMEVPSRSITHRQSIRGAATTTTLLEAVDFLSTAPSAPQLHLTFPSAFMGHRIINTTFIFLGPLSFNAIGSLFG
ncbi:unnamed protein product [Nezara viridula]|uniref:Uncharacterized protein n=1 Tax=Nezara viridula TaxID=85310 RepID=A0A9P0H613_NEZVI|nr:unnamed protein product [Nezara viridula]